MACHTTPFYQMELKKRDVHKIFQKLDLEVRSTNHIYGWLVINGKKILRVHYSFGKGDIPAKISDKIRGQLKLDPTHFKNLIECPLSKEDYLNILKEKGYL
jgi:hypothetical protein